MKIIKIFKKENRKAIINLTDEIFEITFFENEKYFKTIEYPNKTYPYVSKEAENWCDGKLILEKDTQLKPLVTRDYDD